MSWLWRMLLMPISLTGPRSLLGQKPTKKTKLQPATSAPAVPATTVPAKKAVVMSTRDRFSATVLAEEETAQVVLGLKKDKNSAQKEVMIAKIKMEGEIWVVKERARAEEKAGNPFYYDSELPPITTLDTGTGSDGSSYTGLPSSLFGYQ
ncbi:hypothetical protein K438DRAFT_1747284 [Mycena galopus ATCC 62051]|nr:hypothetical protein K438DRAFT_1747284 [Mycena galopus ATCC 62051]